MAYPPPPSSQPPYPQQPYGGPPPPPPPPPVRRGRTPLRLGLIFLVVGIGLIAGGAAVLQTQSLDKVDSFSRVPISTTTSGTAHFSKTGGYVAYYESPGADSKTKNIPIVEIGLTSPSGKLMILQTLYGGRPVQDLKIKPLTYSHNGHDGIAVYQFHISEVGDYKVQFAHTDVAAAGSDMAFGPSIAKGTAIGVALLAPGVLLLIAAIVLLIVGLVKRRNSKRELAAYGGGAQLGYGYPPPGVGYPPPPPGQGYPPPPGNPPYGEPPRTS